MAVLFILLGLSIFLAGFTLYIKKTLVSNRSWAYKCLLFPLLSLLDIRSNWHTSKDSALLQLGGLFILFIGIAFTLNNPTGNSEDLSQKMSGSIELNNKSSKKVVVTHKVEPVQNSSDGSMTDTGLLNKITTSVKSKVSEISEIAKEESSSLISNVQKSRELTGKLNNDSFKPDVITFKEGRLRFKQGVKLFGDKEIIILLPENHFPAQSGLILQVPSDQNTEQNNVPEVHLSWLDGDATIPETKILKNDYTLQLEYELVTEDKFHGRILFDFSNGDFNGKLAGVFVAIRKTPPEITKTTTKSNSAPAPVSEPSLAPIPALEPVKQSSAAEYSKTPDKNISVETLKVKFESTDEQPSTISELPLEDDLVDLENTELVVADETELLFDAMQKELVTAPGEVVLKNEPASEEGLVSESEVTTSAASSPNGEINTAEITNEIAIIEEKPEPEPEPELVPHTDIQEQYLKPETATVLQKLEPFWGKDVLITTESGSTAEGLLKEIRRGEIAVEMRVGAGTMEKLIPVVDFKSVEFK